MLAQKENIFREPQELFYQLSMAPKEAKLTMFYYFLTLLNLLLITVIVMQMNYTGCFM
jgi:hypothetical protein